MVYLHNDIEVCTDVCLVRAEPAKNLHYLVTNTDICQLVFVWQRSRAILKAVVEIF